MTWLHPLMDFTQDSEEESPRNRYSSSATLTTLHYMRPAARLRRGGLAWVENAHGITPAAFCFIKHLVGLSHQQTNSGKSLPEHPATPKLAVTLTLWP